MSVARTHTHVVIPDTQIEPGDPVDHMRWIGQYIVDQFADKPDIHIVHLGDHAAMRSLSVHDSPQEAEGRTYDDDIAAANKAWGMLNAPLVKFNAKRRKYKERQWVLGSRHILLGNHEDHITRAVAENPKLKDTLRLDHLDYERSGWRVVPFLEVLGLHGISYSHFFVNNANGRAISGMIETRIKTIGCTFIQGHQQGLKTGMVETTAGRRRGIVSGSCYLKAEQYRGPQAAGEWRGILILHEVGDGDFDLMEVSLAYLAKRYEGVTIDKFLDRKYGIEWVA